jgi:putative (di)nucleoside polyphosphate hydrolase
MNVEDLHSLPYRPGVGVMLLNAEAKVFVGQRIGMMREAWQMPQGGIDAGEEPRAAALRELEEETGTDKVRYLAETQGWLAYDLPPELVPKVWGGRYRGQRQKWFAMRFTGEDHDIDIQTARPEFGRWKWMEARALPRFIVPFKRALYEAVIAEFRDLLEAGG